MKTVFLVVLVLNGASHGTHTWNYPMANMGLCLNSLKHTITDVAKGGDAEQGVVVFCAETDGHRKSQST